MTSPLTRAHYAEQLRLRAEALKQAQSVWKTWNPANRASWGEVLDLSVPLVDIAHANSAAAAASYFERLVGDTAIMAEPLEAGRIARSLSYTGLGQTRLAMASGFSSEAALQNGLVRFLGSYGRLVLDGGRMTILSSIQASPNVTAWQRITSGNACEFCETLAGRGAVYSESTSEFQAHDHCACTAEPLTA